MGEPLDARFRAGDGVEPRHLNAVYRELRRMRTLAGAGDLVVDGAAGPGPPVVRRTTPPRIFARITGAYSSGYPWEEVAVGPGRSLAATGVTGSAASGDPAFERRVGSTTLTADGTVYEMVRSPASNQWLLARGLVCGNLQVIVKDCSGNALDGASVTATRGGTTLGPLTTNLAGVVNFPPPVADGDWVCTASKSGFQTMSATGTYACATGASVTISYKLYAPATLTLTSGGNSITLNRITSGSTYLYQNQVYYPITAFTIPNTTTYNPGDCSPSPFGALSDWNFSCTVTRYTAYFVPCGAAGTPLNYDYGDQPASGFFSPFRNNSGTVTSFSVSPFLVTGTWGALWNGTPHSAHFPDPGAFGSSFTIS